MDYPTWRYHATEPPRLVHSAEEEAALGPGWADTPAAFGVETHPTVERPWMVLQRWWTSVAKWEDFVEEVESTRRWYAGTPEGASLPADITYLSIVPPPHIQRLMDADAAAKEQAVLSLRDDDTDAAYAHAMHCAVDVPRDVLAQMEKER